MKRLTWKAQVRGLACDSLWPSRVRGLPGRMASCSNKAVGWPLGLLLGYHLLEEMSGVQSRDEVWCADLVFRVWCTGLSVQGWVRPSGQGCPEASGHRVSAGEKLHGQRVLKQTWRSSGRPPASQLCLSVYTK